MEHPAISAAVAALLGNRLNPGPFPGLPEANRPQSLDEAYDLQDALNIALTEAGFGPRVGHKVGCTSKVMQEYMNITHPCSGGVFQTTIYHGSIKQPAARYHSVGVECEIAVRLSGDMPPAGAPYTREAVKGHIKSCMPAIEIVDDRYEDFRSLDLEILVADDFCQAACILGPENVDWHNLDLTKIIGRALVNDIEVGRGMGADILGHPFEALVWLANHKAARNQGLQAGELVFLGSMIQTQWLSPGDKAVIEVDGLGSVSAEFTG